MRLLPSRSAISVLAAVALGATASPVGATWLPRPIPDLPAAVARTLAAHPTDPEVLLAVDALGNLHRTVDGGTTWQRGLAEVELLAFAPPSNASRVYALRTADEQSPLLVSRDAGATFEELPFPQTPDALTPQGGFNRLDFRALAVGTIRADTVFVANFRQFFSGGVIIIDSHHFWRSVDGGQTWQDFGDPTTALAVDRFNQDLVFRGTDLGLRVSRSNGRSFGPEVGFPFLAGIRHIVVDPFRPQGLWVAGAGGLFYSADAGETFTRADGGLPVGEIVSLAADPSQPGTVWLVIDGSGPFVSHDRGRSWESAADGLDPSSFSGPLAVGPGGRVWAGSTDGVLRLDPGPSVCVDSDTALCLLGGRFRVEVEWRDFQGGLGPGRTRPVTGDTGAFWFFDPENLELMVKVIDGREVNGHFWVFYGSLSNVGFALTVTDTVTGARRVFENPTHRFASAGITDAFPASPGAPGAAGATAVGATPAPALQPAPAGLFVPCESRTSLCLQQERFRVEVLWQDFEGGSGRGVAVPLTSDTGAFWFFDPENLELMVKVLDGRTLNGHFWMFLGSLTNVGFEVVVTDIVEGRSWTYRNTSNRFVSVGDTGALPGDGSSP